MGRKTGAILSFLCVCVEVLTALLLTPLLIRRFGHAEYGVYTLVLSVVSYLSLLDLGVGNSVTRYMAKYKVHQQREKQQNFLGMTTVFYISVAFLVMIAGGVLIGVLPAMFEKGLSREELDLARMLLIVACINTAIVMGTSNYFYTVIAYENFWVTKGVTIIITGLRIGVTVIALNNSCGSLGVMLVNTAANAIIRGIIVIYVLCKMKIRPRLIGIHKSEVKEVFLFSSITMLQLVATQINSMADQILIGMIVPSSSVILGIYGIGAQINHYFQTFGRAFTGVLMPGVVKIVEKDGTVESLQTEMVRIGRMVFSFLGIVWCVFLINGREFIELWTGTANDGAYVVALLLTLPMTIIMSQSIGSQILWAKNKHKKQAILKFVTVIINLILTIWLVKWNPLLGATIGTAISLVIGDIVVMQVVFKKDIGICLRGYYRELFSGIIPALVISLICGSGLSFLEMEGMGGFILNCVVMIVVYLIAMFTFGFTKNEKEKIKIICLKFVKAREDKC